MSTGASEGAVMIENVLSSDRFKAFVSSMLAELDKVTDINIKVEDQCARGRGLARDVFP